MREKRTKAPRQTIFNEAEIAKAIGVSRQRVNQIIEVAKKKLRKGLLADPYVKEWIREHAEK